MCLGTAALGHKAAVGHWLLAFGSFIRQPIVRDQPSFFRATTFQKTCQHPAVNYHLQAKSQKPKAKSQKPKQAKSQRPTPKCRLFNILPASLTGSRFYRPTFPPPQWNQDFTRIPREGWNDCRLFSCRSSVDRTGSWQLGAFSNPAGGYTGGGKGARKKQVLRFAQDDKRDCPAGGWKLAAVKEKSHLAVCKMA